VEKQAPSAEEGVKVHSEWCVPQQPNAIRDGREGWERKAKILGNYCVGYGELCTVWERVLSPIHQTKHVEQDVG